MAFVGKKPTAEPAGVDATWADAGFVSYYPALWEYLTVRSYEDGKERRTSTLLFFVEGPELKACLNDRECGRTLWTAGGTIQELLRSLEEALESPKPGWRLQGNHTLRRPAKKSP